MRLKRFDYRFINISVNHKSGDKANVCNYKHISKLSDIPKMFEATITKRLSFLMSQITTII